jgi:hypothetical protein
MVMDNGRDPSTTTISHQPSAMRLPLAIQRLWRVRKDHTWIDAQIHESDGGVDVAFLYDGERIWSHRYATRELGADAAARTLHDLQRAGWTLHW